MEQEQQTQAFELKLLYILSGVAAALGLLALLYRSLRLNASVTTLLDTTAHSPLYLWLYVFLTALTVIGFGVHASLLVFRWRTYKKPEIKGSVSSALGSIVGIFASACPSCGSLLLSAIGISSGLLAFPLAGLELKALSCALVIVPLFILARKIQKEKMLCESGDCPAPAHDAFRHSDKKWVALLCIAIIALCLSLWHMAKSESAAVQPAETVSANPQADAFFEVMAKQVVPDEGFQSAIRLNGAIVALAEAKVIDKEKVDALYEGHGGTPAFFADLMTKPMSEPMHLTSQNAPYYLNALWALGLANRMEANRTSPVAGADLFNFASTGGWTLGAEENGGAYFNNYAIVALSPEQEALVRRVAENTYRPCCDNSSFFQDCNHGSAILGLLELGASQGLGEDELYAEALHFNAYWFPDQYIQTAMYFKSIENIDWENIDPRLVMSKFYSSASGWYNTVYSALQKKHLIPNGQIGGTGC